MQQALLISAVLILVLVTGAMMERRRHVMLQAWVNSHPGARLHWGFVPEQMPAVPAIQLATDLLGREPPRWAGAVETPTACLAELSISRNASETSKWYVLVAKRKSDGTWDAKLENGLMSKAMLDAAAS